MSPGQDWEWIPLCDHIVPGVGEAHGAHGEKVGDYHEGDVVPEQNTNYTLKS